MPKLTTRKQRIASLKYRFPSRNPNKREGAKTVVSRDLAMHIAKTVVSKTPRKAARWVRAAILPALPLSSNWHKAAKKLASALWDMPTMIAAESPYTIFERGNGKLPYFTWSTLPAVTCPGAGACLAWCYSFTGWRHVNPFFRQTFCTMLLMHRPDIVRETFQALPHGSTVRIYVDGDFSSVADVEFWMDTIRRRGDLHTFGYSKSWRELIEYGNAHRFPNNYCLNKSSGSLHGADVERELLALQCDDGKPVVRGVFQAVRINRSGTDIPRGHERYESREYHQAVRTAALPILGQRAFSCPGNCGDCRGENLAFCAARSLSVPVAIGIH